MEGFWSFFGLTKVPVVSSWRLEMMAELPRELSSHILRFLSPKDLGSLCLVNKFFYDMCSRPEIFPTVRPVHPKLGMDMRHRPSLMLSRQRFRNMRHVDLSSTADHLRDAVLLVLAHGPVPHVEQSPSARQSAWWQQLDDDTDTADSAVSCLCPGCIGRTSRTWSVSAALPFPHLDTLSIRLAYPLPAEPAAALEALAPQLTSLTIFFDPDQVQSSAGPNPSVLRLIGSVLRAAPNLSHLSFCCSEQPSLRSLIHQVPFRGRVDFTLPA